MKHTALRDVLSVTKALSDAQRVRILMLLRDGELCVCQIVAVLRLANSTISKHLSILSTSGLVEVRKDGRWSYYRPAAAEHALRWIWKELGGDDQIRADQTLLNKIKRQSLEVLCRQQRPN